MQKKNGQILFSASDVVSFLECEHLTTLDLINLDTPLPKAEDDEETQLFAHKGLAHEAAWREQLRRQGFGVCEISAGREDHEGAVVKTLAAICSGVDVVYQAALKDGFFIGHADFLRRVAVPSALGDHSYEVTDTKLARSPKAAYLIQLCFYSELVAVAQGRDPAFMHVVLGDGREEGYRYAEYARYYASLKERFLVAVNSGPRSTYPDPCERCDICRWRNLCEERRLQDDHLWQVANIRRQQIRRLNQHGVATLKALAELPEEMRIPRMVPETLEKLRRQAALQLHKRQTGEDVHELLPIDLERKRGFARLPKPDDGDLFFDMEGDPLEDGGLEYLFGVAHRRRDDYHYRSFWAHSRREEQRAFEKFMDFIAERLRKHPAAHIYHYGHYEETALKRLMSLHGTREAEVDNLLRTGKLVDLFKVVREGLRISEPSYSLKNVERFFMENRTGDIQNAGASIVAYERWKESGESAVLQQIEAYNRDDVLSTAGLRDWLLTLRPQELSWAGDDARAGLKAKDIKDLNEHERRLLHYRQLLIEQLPEDCEAWTEEHHLRELTFQLLDFHRRAEKPLWWALFSRREQTAEDLMEDMEAIGGMTPDIDAPAGGHGGRYAYRYPEQETKLKTGDACVRTDTLERLSNVEIDETTRRVTFSCRSNVPPEELSIGSGGPLPTKILKEALFRFAEALISKAKKYDVLKAILKHDLPCIKGHPAGAPIIDENGDPVQQTIEAAAKLIQSYLFIQGPPGAGKTYTGAHVIVELLRRGRRIAVSSNSHKAINNLLSHIERVAKERQVTFRGVKKSTAGNPDSAFEGEFIKDVFNNDDVEGYNAQLVAGTAWLFSREEFDEAFEYLFIDEAGQVALANLIAMGTCAKNIILLGDQMQLGQPIQGVHPGRSGESTLEYLLDGLATIPPERGVFLKTTWRMHPDVCRFISDAVYDSRLEAHPDNARQGLVLNRKAHPLLKPTGIQYIPAGHEGCSQRSEEEAAVVLALYSSLLNQHYVDKNGKKRRLGPESILIVAPYNMQVNMLKATLPPEARIGTVDKFQGQEAEVVIISMATSSGDDLPRNIEFLYSKNRLNVAISRARCLAVLIANPALMAIRCTTPDQMALVNTLCWARDYRIN